MNDAVRMTIPSITVEAVEMMLKETHVERNMVTITMTLAELDNFTAAAVQAERYRIANEIESNTTLLRLWDEETALHFVMTDDAASMIRRGGS